jgi:NitT/TauT family transport system substrate-binding protein
MVSNRAYEAGVTSLKNVAGRSVAVSQTGAPGHYVIGALAEKYGVDLAKLRVLPLQSVPNIYSALTGGQADLGVTIITVPIMPSIDRGDLRILAWVGDEMAFQDRGFFVATKTANERRDTIERFFRGYLKGVADYRAAFIGSDDKPKNGPTAPDILAIIGKYVGQPVEAIKLGIAYVEPQLRVNVPDILHQIAWYKSQGMLKNDVNGDDILDKRYVIPLPQK